VAILGIAALFLALTRSFTRAGLLAMACAPFMAWLLGLEPMLIGGVAILVVLLLFAHRDNWLPGRNVPEKSEKGLSVSSSGEARNH
jgi:membrane protein implicated in regulation of membrane protease activity